MNDKNYTQEQNELIAELASTYGIEPEEVIFFANDPKPFFSYEATAVLCNKLTDIAGIDIEPVNNGFADSVCYRCNLTIDNRSRSGVGVANVAEKGSDDSKLESAQLIELASGRAIRNALRVAGIDLLKLHNQRKSGVVQFSGQPQTQRSKDLRESHALGNEAGLIKDGDKTAWYAIIANRYEVIGCDALTDEQLTDFVAFLRSLVSGESRQKAA